MKYPDKAGGYFNYEVLFFFFYYYFVVHTKVKYLKISLLYKIVLKL